MLCMNLQEYIDVEVGRGQMMTAIFIIVGIAMKNFGLSRNEGSQAYKISNLSRDPTVVKLGLTIYAYSCWIPGQVGQFIKLVMHH